MGPIYKDWIEEQECLSGTDCVSFENRRNFRKETLKNERDCCAATYRASRMATQCLRLTPSKRWPARSKFRCINSSTTASSLRRLQKVRFRRWNGTVEEGTHGYFSDCRCYWEEWMSGTDS